MADWSYSLVLEVKIWQSKATTKLMTLEAQEKEELIMIYSVVVKCHGSSNPSWELFTNVDNRSSKAKCQQWLNLDPGCWMVIILALHYEIFKEEALETMKYCERVKNIMNGNCTQEIYNF